MKFRNSARFLFSVVLAAITSSAAFASITLSGNYAGSAGIPYNGADDPWAVSNLVVGNSSAGSMTVNGGYVVNNTGGANIANSTAASTSAVSVSGAGSSWTNTGNMSVGSVGIATVTVSNGGAVSNNTGLVGNTSGSTGTVTVGGGTGTSTWSNPNGIVIGLNGNGTLSIVSGGSVTSSAAITIGQNAGSNGNLNVGGGTGPSTLTHSASLGIGSSGTGIVTISGGGSVSNTSATLAATAGGSATVTVGGGMGAASWANSGSLSVGGGGSATLNLLSGGLVSATALNGGNPGSSVKFNGGTLRITANDAASNTIALLSGGGTIEVPTAGTIFTVSSAVSGVGDLTKTGPAILSLTGANNYNGNTIVNDGTLKITGSGSMASTPVISVVGGAKLDVSGVTGGSNYDGTRFSLQSGQTIKLAGTVTGPMAVGSGASFSTAEVGTTGLATVNGGLTFAAGSQTYFDLGGTNRGFVTNGYDTVDGVTSLGLGGLIHVNLTNGFNPSLGTTFNLFGWGNLSPVGVGAVVDSGHSWDFSGAPLDPGLEWDTGSFLLNGSITVAAPEPGRAALILVGFGACAMRRRR